MPTHAPMHQQVPHVLLPADVTCSKIGSQAQLFSVPIRAPALHHLYPHPHLLLHPHPHAHPHLHHQQ